jgi:hypothetical protein
MKDSTSKLCEIIIKESEFESNDPIIEKLNKIKIRLLHYIDRDSNQNKAISPIINRNVNIVVFHFENINNLIQYKNELNSFIVNNLSILLINTQINYIIESDQILRINIYYNKINEDIIKKITTGFHENEITNQFISYINVHFDKPKEIKPFHIKLKNKDEAKKFLKNIEK